MPISVVDTYRNMFARSGSGRVHGDTRARQGGLHRFYVAFIYALYSFCESE